MNIKIYVLCEKLKNLFLLKKCNVNVSFDSRREIH